MGQTCDEEVSTHEVANSLLHNSHCIVSDRLRRHPQVALVEVRSWAAEV